MIVGSDFDDDKGDRSGSAYIFSINCIRFDESGICFIGDVTLKQDLNVNCNELKNVYTSRANAYRNSEVTEETVIENTVPILLNSGSLVLNNSVDFTESNGVLTYTGSQTKWFRIEYHVSLFHVLPGIIKELKTFIALDPTGTKTEQPQSRCIIKTQYEGQFTGYCEMQLSQNEEIGICVQNKTDQTNLVCYTVSLSVKQLHQ